MNEVTERFGSDWGENPLTLAVADQDPNLSYGTDLGRTMITTDGGATWYAACSKKTGNGGWTTTGLDLTTAYGYHFDPFDQNRQCISTIDIGLFRSEDGGKSWISSAKGVRRDWTNYVLDRLRSQSEGRVWSVNGWTHDLPRPKIWRHSSVAKYRGGVCISLDGRTWSKSDRKQLGLGRLIVGENVPRTALLIDCRGRAKLGDNETATIYVVVCQLLAFFCCLEGGVRADSPSEGGVINRVVESFPLHKPS